MNITTALEILNKKNINVEVRRSNLIEFTGSYADMFEIDHLSKISTFVFRNKWDEIGRYMVDQKEAGCHKWYESTEVGLQVIMAMRTVAQEYANS